MKIGDIIWFGRKYGEKTKAKIVKVNSKTVKVRLEESRGIGRGHAVGSLWTVHRTLCLDSLGHPLEIPRTRREARTSDPLPPPQNPPPLPPIVSQALDKLTREEQIALIQHFSANR